MQNPNAIILCIQGKREIISLSYDFVSSFLTIQVNPHVIMHLFNCFFYLIYNLLLKE